MVRDKNHKLLAIGNKPILEKDADKHLRILKK
jgi:hypothetical protein